MFSAPTAWFVTQTAMTYLKQAPVEVYELETSLHEHPVQQLVKVKGPNQSTPEGFLDKTTQPESPGRDL